MPPFPLSPLVERAAFRIDPGEDTAGDNNSRKRPMELAFVIMEARQHDTHGMLRVGWCPLSRSELGPTFPRC